MTVKEIIKDYLIKNGFHGLYNPGECGCITADLIPCDGPCHECQPGYLTDCNCGEHDWHISPEKKEPSK